MAGLRQADPWLSAVADHEDVLQASVEGMPHGILTGWNKGDGFAERVVLNRFLWMFCVGFWGFHGDSPTV